MAHEERMIDVQLTRLVLRDGSGKQCIFLTEASGQRGFPIVIGTTEAAEIHRVLTDDDPKRPMTHRLTYDAIERLGGRIVGVDVVDLRDNTFFARLALQGATGDIHQLDARPSDALALGLRAGCPIRVAESILEEVRTDSSGPDPLPPAEGDPREEGPGGDPGGSTQDPEAD